MHYLLASDVNVPLLLVGLLRACIWVYGAIWSFKRKRALLLFACCTAIPQAVILSYHLAGGTVSDATLDSVAVGSTLTVGLLIASFVSQQPKHARRPGRWTS